MQYKIICLDLDGTLLNDKKEVPEGNIDAINKLYRDYGVIPVLVTGKNLSWAEHILSLFNEEIPKYAVVSNGGIVKDFNKEIFIRRKLINKESRIKISEIAKKYNLGINIQTETNDIHDEGVDYNINNEQLDITQVSLFGDEETLKLAINKINDTDKLEDTGIMIWRVAHGEKTHTSTYIDIMAKGSTKANGILILLKHLGLEVSDIITIGDGSNDIPMFELGGFNVVMENAECYLKKYADHITTSNNENGVAKAIKHIFYN